MLRTFILVNLMLKTQPQQLVITNCHGPMFKKAGAMVTGPINKSILRSNNEFEFSGHTDYLEHLCGCKKDTALMMMLNKYLKIIPFTIHKPLNQVSSKKKGLRLKEKFH